VDNVQKFVILTTRHHHKHSELTEEHTSHGAVQKVCSDIGIGRRQIAEAFDRCASKICTKLRII
jgi:hypothetical protein